MIGGRFTSTGAGAGAFGGCRVGTFGGAGAFGGCHDLGVGNGFLGTAIPRPSPVSGYINAPLKTSVPTPTLPQSRQQAPVTPDSLVAFVLLALAPRRLDPVVPQAGE